MSRIAAFDVRPDEQGAFALAEAELGVEIELHAEPLSAQTLPTLGEGIAAVSVLGKSELDADLLAALSARGVVYAGTRSIGYNNVDVKAAEKLGMHVANASYAPDGVAEFTVMMMLMALRKIKQINARSLIQDYALVGSCGRQLGDARVGIIGTGRIGAKVADIVKGFGAQVVGYDVVPNPALAGVVDYVDLDELLQSCDVITLHAPLLESNHHMLDERAFSLMKDGVTLVNCSRGELVDTDALIAAVESGKVGAVAADVIEHDLEYFHQDLRHDVIRNRQLAILRSFSNVLLTPHVAFYTDRAVKDMVFSSITALMSFLDSGTSPLEVTGKG